LVFGSGLSILPSPPECNGWFAAVLFLRLCVARPEMVFPCCDGRGKRQPSLGTIFLLAAGLAVEPERLVREVKKLRPKLRT